MKEQDLIFDRKKHILYSDQVKKVIQDRLRADYPADQADRLWEQTRKNFVAILEDLPDMGGSKNMQSASVYDCAALFAYYQAVPEKPTLEVFGRMNEDLFVPAMARASYANLNRPLFMKAAGCIWRHLAKVNLRRREDWPGNYIMEMREVPEGCKYVFLRCPIAEMAKRLGLTHLRPAMCNPDYPMLEQLGAGLIRTTTCAHGDCCDFWIVGSESPLLQQHLVKQSEEGYLYNE